MTRIQIDLGSVQCNTGTVDSDGILWTCGWPEGWDSADQRTKVDDPTGSHGGIPRENLFAARDIVIKGRCRGTDAALAIAYRKVTGSLPGLLGSMDLVVHETVPLFLTVEQGGKPYANRPEKGYLLWSVMLRADYPFKRATTPVTVPISAGGTATFTAAGTFAAELKITTSSAGVVSVGSYGATLGTTASMPAGSVLDSLDRSIVDDTGADRYGLIAPQSQWLAVSPGSNTFTSASDVVLSYYPTYP